MLRGTLRYMCNGTFMQLFEKVNAVLGDVILYTGVCITLYMSLVLLILLSER